MNNETHNYDYVRGRNDDDEAISTLMTKDAITRLVWAGHGKRG
jgi:hypothetical protein